MLYYDPNGRLQLAREHADRLATEMERTRRLTREEARLFDPARIGLWLSRSVDRVLRRRGRHVHAYGA